MPRCLVAVESMVEQRCHGQDAQGASEEPPADPSPTQRDKYKSPPPPPESMTPPPSSQAPALASAVELTSKARTPTPTPTQLSSPPRTDHRQRSADYGIFTAAQVEAASPDDKNDMIAAIAKEWRDARASAAHHRLQREWAQIESEKAVETMGVELDMANREIRVLQSQFHRSSAPADEQQIAHWRNACVMQEYENNALRDAFERQSADFRYQLADRDEHLASTLTENSQLRERIRDNRAHMNLWRDKTSHDTPSLAMPQTPARQTAPRDPFQTPVSKTKGNEGFAALLMATDREYRHEIASTPSSPVPRDTKRTHLGHHRGSQSLSTITSTPNAARTAPQPNRGQVLQYNAMPQYHQSSPLRQPHTPVHRRRRSRDSTISAGESDDEHRHEAIPDHQVYESHASQAATDILRKSNSSSFRHNEASGQGSPKQTKLYGQITKPGAEKRKIIDDDEDDAHMLKKARTREGVGLGIGGWAVNPTH
ncbi:hypothetical protein FH972_026508 [Carpinus fangiana]|uniref:Uncharacterized protein n=1 Tax=Carpinus fangiana TaxID=176857 RepID=A0A5N6L466_9ROSI|nr:hypothetical protein FH972_026508 [Carpinus fangiana]